MPGPNDGVENALVRTDSQYDEARRLGMNSPSPSKGPPKKSRASDQSTSRPERPAVDSIRNPRLRGCVPMPMTRHPTGAAPSNAADSPRRACIPRVEFPRQSHDHHRPRVVPGQRWVRNSQDGTTQNNLATRRDAVLASLAYGDGNMIRRNAATPHRALLRRYRSDFDGRFENWHSRIEAPTSSPELTARATPGIDSPPGPMACPGRSRRDRTTPALGIDARESRSSVIRVWAKTALLGPSAIDPRFGTRG